MKIPPQFQALADRFGIPLPLVLAASGFVVLLTLALLTGLASSATHHTPAPQAIHPPLQAQAGPVGPAPAVAGKAAPTPTPANVNAAPPAASRALVTTSLASAMLPVLPAPPGALQSGAWQVQVFTLPQGQAAAPTLLGSATQQSPTASIAAAIPTQLAPFITTTSPVRLIYSMYFQAPQAGEYLLVARLGGKATASLSTSLDGRADTLLEASRDFNPYWPDKSPPQAATAMVNLAPGLHRLDVTVDCKATQTPGQAATVRAAAAGAVTTANTYTTQQIQALQSIINNATASGLCKYNGQGGIVCGANTTAAAGAVAQGDGASAGYAGSLAIGQGATITAPTSNDGMATGAVAIGFGARANADPATAIGYQANAAGANSVALGYQATANGTLPNP